MMIFAGSIIFFLILQTFADAEDNSIRSTGIPWHYSYVIGILIGSVFITIVFTSLAFLILKYMKKKFSQPQYYADDVSIQKVGYEYNDIGSQVPHLHQIQPILTVSQVVSSIRQSLEDFGHVLVPQRWSTTVIKETPVQEKTDLSI